MTTIWIYRKVRLKGFTLSVPVRRRLPTSWQDLSQKRALQFVYFLMIHKLPFGQEIPYHIRFEILNAWLKISPKEFARFTDLQISILMQKVDPIFEEAKTIPKFKTGKYRLPAELLESETVEAFAVYEEYYANILEGIDIEHNLNWLCAYLMRKKEQAVDTKVANDMIKRVKELLPAQRFYIYWWYAVTREALVEKYPGAFGRTDRSSGKKGPDYTSHFRWFGCIFHVAQDGPFGNELQVKSTDVHSFLTYLDFNDGKAREIEANMKNTK